MEIGSWTEYGLSGLVISALLGGLWWIIKGHREERKEWREDASARQEKTDMVIKELADAIKDTWHHMRRP